MEGFPRGSAGQECLHAGDMGLIFGLGRSPGEGNGNPLHYSCLRNPTDRGAWWDTVMELQRVGPDWAHKLITRWRGERYNQIFFFIHLKKYLFLFTYLTVPSLSCSTQDLLVAACGIPDQGPNPGSLHWELGGLATGPPGNSLDSFLMGLLAAVLREKQGNGWETLAMTQSRG